MERPYLKAYPKDVRWELDFPAVPVYQMLFDQSQAHPERTALIFMGKRISYRELVELVDRFGAALQRRYGIRKGDRVGIILPNSPQNVIATFACQRIGAIPVQFNPLYVAREIAYQVRDSGSRLMITLDLFWQKVREAGGAEAYIWTGVQDFLNFPLNFLYRMKAKPPRIPASDAAHFMDLLQESPDAIQVAPVEPKEDLAVLLYTGGTTGVSKGVMLTHSNITANITQIREWIGMDDSRHHTVLAVLPMFHSYGFTAAVNTGLATGSTVVLVPRFEAGDLLKTIAKYRPTIFPGVPTMYVGLLNHPDVGKYDLSSIELCVTGAASMPVELLQKFEQVTGATIMEGYGLTETSPVTHANPRTGKRIPGSVGLPYPGTDVRIVDLETGEDLPPGGEGEVVIRGPQVMKGYWNKPEETAATLRDGWLYTGDIGRMDEDGYLYIVDRKKDMIIAGGFNIYPREIDEVLYQHPAVLEACAVGVPDAYRGETVKAFVVLKPGMHATEQEILDFCRERLAAYKRPRSVEFLPELPKSTVGKVLRRELVEREKQKSTSAVS
ncbi:MAG: long-chain fatty acid--CoA ligase [Symbiobacterium sp.]|uniref:long-chain fatty acid--CoA ligase n=1 Tax=Symbiobacterium sp. TaxID=1971213 RepID=UPI0034638FF6